MRLQEKVAIVTGAASGIGKAIADRFAREGTLVIAADKNESKWFPKMSTQDRGPNETDASMTYANLTCVADKQVLYRTTVGRRTGLPREIEIWFVIWCERLYLFTQTREAAGWVKNIGRDPKVMVRIGDWRTNATARVLDRHIDRKLWDQVAAIANRKYGWGDGLPVEITPLP
jgi:deazaflavin-dependent oxidoreductase (nitroreductase family)